MTAEIINFNKARKARARADKERRAEENRIRHGRTKAEREAEDARRALETAQLEGNRLSSHRDAGQRRTDAEEDLDPGNVS